VLAARALCGFAMADKIDARKLGPLGRRSSMACSPTSATTAIGGLEAVSDDAYEAAWGRRRQRTAKDTRTRLKAVSRRSP
jgi:hypothetical protein